MKERQREVFQQLVHFPSACFSQVKPRHPELHPAAPQEWQGSNHVSRPLLPPALHTGRKLDLEAEPGLKPRHADTGWGLPKWHLHFSTQTPSLILLFLNEGLLPVYHFPRSEALWEGRREVRFSQTDAPSFESSLILDLILC